MKKLQNLEIINIQTKNGKLVATLSYQDIDNLSNINNGYSIIDVPLNIRQLQISDRGNILVNQSVRSYDTVTNPDL